MTLDEIEARRIAYEKKARPETEFMGSSDLFYSWYNAAKAFFKVNIKNDDEDYQAFSNSEPSGNEYVLHSYYQMLSGRYFALKSLYESNKGEKEVMNKSKIFIVHGHDELLMNQVLVLMYSLGLEPIVLSEKANKGKSLLDKLEENTDVGFAIILYTPCDLGKEKNEESFNFRARQNVVFEHGYLIGKLGKDHVSILKKGEVEIPSDLAGTAYTEGDDWKISIIKDLKAAGIDIDLDKFMR